MDRRILLRHITGPLAGKVQIVGSLPRFVEDYPVVVTDLEGIPAHFVRMTKTYVLYHEGLTA